MTAIVLADNEISTEAKAEDCKKAISAGHEALQIYDASSYPEEYAEAQILLWAAYSALAEVQDCRENCRRAIEACRDAIAIYERISPAEHADALKNLGYSFITMAEMEDKADNCQRAIDACEQAMQYYTLETAPLEHADILRDLAFAYVTFSEVRDKEECSKKALKAYEKAFKIYQTRAEELDGNGDAGAYEMLEKAQRCHLSMQSCKAILKAGRKAGAAAASLHKKQEKTGEAGSEEGSMTGLTDGQKTEYFRRSYTAVDGLWFMKIEETLGFDEALRLDEAVWKVLPKIQARALKEMMHLQSGLPGLWQALSARLSPGGLRV